MLIPTRAQVMLASADLVSGAVDCRRIWARLAQHGIKNRYQKTVLGPFWIVLTTTIMVLTFGVIYAEFFNRPIAVHLPYVAVGLVLWGFYTDLFVKGCQLFIRNSRMIHQMKMPYSVYLYLHAMEGFIVLLHNLSIVIVVFLVFRVGISPVLLLQSLAGFAIIAINAIAGALLFALISTRYRDFRAVIGSFMRPMMFITPIIWNPELRANRAAFIQWNPFYHLIDICRGPLLGKPAAAESWLISLGATALLLTLAFLLFSRYRGRIAYWV